MSDTARPSKSHDDTDAPAAGSWQPRMPAIAPEGTANERARRGKAPAPTRLEAWGLWIEACLGYIEHVDGSSRNRRALDAR